jgi:hypothetical protein
MQTCIKKHTDDYGFHEYSAHKRTNRGKTPELAGLLGLNENVSIARTQHKFTDEFLCDWDSSGVRHAQI